MLRKLVKLLCGWVSNGFRIDDLSVDSVFRLIDDEDDSSFILHSFIHPFKIENTAFTRAVECSVVAFFRRLLVP